tara:strand:+ start:1350 stop:2360 length:1011 start_codon:yes stop_codon:yes gene_type:complete
MLYFYFIYTCSAIILAIFIHKKNFLSNYSGDNHQLFSNKKNVPLIGGLFLIIPLVLLYYQNTFYIITLISVALIGLLSDRKILVSAKKRFLFQLSLIVLSVIFLDLEILSSRLIFFDNLLNIYVFNLFFTSFCLLILINGSNFIDGLNGLLLIYMTFVILFLLKLGLLSKLPFEKNFITYLIFFLAILIILNLSNILMLGDTGAYLLSFFVGYLIINCHNLNPYISPYFFIMLIWYPCFENLFSIIRKLKSNISPFDPDNSHLHQLVYTFIKRKISKNRLVANNISGLIINAFNFIIIFIGSAKVYDSVYQISLIIISTLIYIFLYLFLKSNLGKK